MYGTVARLRVKPGMDGKLLELLRDFETAQVSGAVALYVYQMDTDPSIFYEAVVFESKATYIANSNSPEQHARYLKVLELLEGEPEWHDGAIVYALA